MNPDELSTAQLAARWGLSAHTLCAWRRQGTGPPWVSRPQRHTPRGTPLVFYRLHDVLAYEATNNITPRP